MSKSCIELFSNVDFKVVILKDSFFFLGDGFGLALFSIYLFCCIIEYVGLC